MAAVAQAKETGPMLERQEISVTLDPENHLLTGESVFKYAPGPAREVVLRLSPRAKIKFLKVDEKSAPFNFSDGVLSVRLPASREAVEVEVSYRASFNDPVSRHPAAAEDPSYGVNGTITREGTFLGGEALWYPVPSEVPGRRSIDIAAPLGTEAITFGKRISRKSSGTVTSSAWAEARPVGVLSLSAGPYRIEERQVNGIDLYSYLYPDNAALSARYLDAAAKYLSFYSSLFGPYPFEKFAVVENFFPTGYGFPSFTLLGGAVIRLPFILDTSFPHEIAHSWWGNGIEVELAEGNWCEGLVTYLADYYLKERKSPAEASEYRKQLLIDYSTLVSPPSDFPLTQFTSRSDPASRSIGYGKAAMLFHMVRREIGDRAFFEALREICREHMYRSASWSDFVRAFSRSAGRDLAPFMEQWLTRTGGPRLTLAGVNSRRQGEHWIVTGSIVQRSPLFELPVPLRLETAGGPVGRTVQVTGERTPFSMETAAPPGRLLLDPDADVFRILTPGEIPATVNSIKGASRLVGVITKNCRAEAGTFKNLLASLSQEGVPVIEEGQLDRAEVAKADLVFCGLPHDRSLLPSFPKGVEVTSSGFTLEGTPFPGPDGLLLLVLQRPGSERVAALFQPLSPAAAEQYAPKITHYGKFGYLAFAGGANRRKGTAATADRSVVVDLQP